MTVDIKEILDMIETISIDYSNSSSVQKALSDLRKGLESKMDEINEGMVIQHGNT